MKIYLSHASNYDYTNELYIPIKTSGLVDTYNFVLPHDSDDTGENTKDIIMSSDLVIAEVSFPSTGQGIELGWANDNHVPVVCIYKSGAKISGALRFITDNFVVYADTDDMIVQLTAWLHKNT